LSEKEGESFRVVKSKDERVRKPFNENEHPSISSVDKDKKGKGK